MSATNAHQEIHLVNPLAGYSAYHDEIDAAIRRVLQSGSYVLGREVSAFESAFAAFCGTTNSVGVANGTDAICLALRSLGIGPGDTVFTVAHTAVATVAGIELAGAIPVLIDVEPDGYTIDTAKLLETLRVGKSAEGQRLRPRAVVAVHLYGHPCDLSRLREICARYELLLIEDCAQAHGATFEGATVGTFGAAGAFSFYPTKNLGAFGDGGAVIFADSGAEGRCRALRQYGWNTADRVSTIPGLNSRLDELHAAILSVRLEHLADELAARRAIAARYNEQLADVVVTPFVRPGAQHAYHLYVVRARRRDELRVALSRAGIHTGIHYALPVHMHDAYRSRLVGAGGLSVTDLLCTEILSLPMHPFLSPGDVDRVCSEIRRLA